MSEPIANSASEIWAPALSSDGQYLAGTTQDGHIKVWDLKANGEQIRDHETKGSFGTCLDLVRRDKTLRFTVELFELILR